MVLFIRSNWNVMPYVVRGRRRARRLGLGLYRTKAKQMQGKMVGAKSYDTVAPAELRSKKKSRFNVCISVFDPRYLGSRAE